MSSAAQFKAVFLAEIGSSGLQHLDLPHASTYAASCSHPAMHREQARQADEGTTIFSDCAVQRRSCLVQGRQLSCQLRWLPQQRCPA